jgi:hypothetical protein
MHPLLFLLNLNFVGQILILNLKTGRILHHVYASYAHVVRVQATWWSRALPVGQINFPLVVLLKEGVVLDVALLLLHLVRDNLARVGLTLL